MLFRSAAAAPCVHAERLQVTVLPQLGGPLLGMDVLSRLSFTQTDGVLRLSRP